MSVDIFFSWLSDFYLYNVPYNVASLSPFTLIELPEKKIG